MDYVYLSNLCTVWDCHDFIEEAVAYIFILEAAENVLKGEDSTLH